MRSVQAAVERRLPKADRHFRLIAAWLELADELKGHVVILTSVGLIANCGCLVSHGLARRAGVAASVPDASAVARASRPFCISEVTGETPALLCHPKTRGPAIAERSGFSQRQRSRIDTGLPEP